MTKKLGFKYKFWGISCLRPVFFMLYAVLIFLPKIVFAGTGGRLVDGQTVNIDGIQYKVVFTDETGDGQFHAPKAMSGDVILQSASLDAYEPNDTMNTAYSISFGTLYSATLHNADDLDFFKAYVVNCDSVTISADLREGYGWLAGIGYVLGDTVYSTKHISYNQQVSVTREFGTPFTGWVYFFFWDDVWPYTTGSYSFTATAQMPDYTPPTGSPTKPVISQNGENARNIIISWTNGNSADPESGIAGYYLEVGTDGNSTKYFSGNAGNVFQKTLSIPEDANVYARVKAVNGAGLTGSFSLVSDVYISLDTTPPAKMDAPAVSVQQPGGNSRYIKVIWSAGNDPESGISGYYVEVGTLADSDKYYGGLLASALEITMMIPDDADVLARVYAVNGSGFAGEFSNLSLKYEARDTTMPEGEPGKPVISQNNTGLGEIRIDWNAGSCVDPESGIAGYRLQIGDGVNQTKYFNGNVGDVFTYVFAVPNPDTFVAAVQAVNGSGLAGTAIKSDGYTLLDITVPEGKPSKPVISKSGDAFGSVEILWDIGNCSDPESGINGYFLEVGTLEEKDKYFKGVIHSPVGQKLLIIPELTTICARVLAVNGVGMYGEFSELSDLFEITDDTPPVGTPSRPVIMQYGDSPSNIRVNWQQGTSHDDESGIDGYLLEVGTADNLQRYFNSNVGNVYQENLIIAENATVFARVRAVNGVGLMGNPSEISLPYNTVPVVGQKYFDDSSIPASLSVSSGEAKVWGGQKGYVNPARNEVVDVIFKAGGPGTIKFNIYTLRGGLVLTRSVETDGNTGRFTWECRNEDSSIVASGVYLVHIKGPGINTTKKVAIVQ